MGDSRDPKTFFLTQPLFTAGMTPLEKVMVIDSVTNLVVNMLTNGQKRASDLRDDVFEMISAAQYKLLIDPATKQTENPTIEHIYNGTRRAMERIAQLGQTAFKGSGLVGSGLWEQIQHHSRILDATATKFNKLRQRHAKLVREAEALGQAFQARGEEMSQNHPAVQKLLLAFTKLEGKMAEAQARTSQLAQLIEQLHVQRDQEQEIEAQGNQENA